MEECMTNVVMAATKMAIQKVKYIFVSYDEITNINNQSWISRRHQSW
jgi:hypothetical protein